MGATGEGGGWTDERLRGQIAYSMALKMLAIAVTDEQAARDLAIAGDYTSIFENLPEAALNHRAFFGRMYLAEIREEERKSTARSERLALT